MDGYHQLKTSHHGRKRINAETTISYGTQHESRTRTLKLEEAANNHEIVFRISRKEGDSFERANGKIAKLKISFTERRAS